jgi:rhodanese-related sulfurtransferase
MSAGTGPSVSEVMPTEAWGILRDDQNSVLVDVRSAAEWGFVGIPDVSELGKSVLMVEWARFPGMVPNPDFVRDLREKLDGSAPSRLLFLCRSGVRSLNAAKAVARAYGEDGLPVLCTNVAEGFEGDLDTLKHRGVLSGWKARGLAWRQS